MSRYRDQVRDHAQALGWSVASGKEDLVCSGRLRDGSAFTLEAWLYDDIFATPDRLEWRTGRLPLDRLLAAVTNNPRGKRRWVRDFLAGQWEGFRHDVGSDLAVLELERSGVDVDLQLPDSAGRLSALAASPELAERIFTAEVRRRLARARRHATGFPGRSLEAFAGASFLVVRLETRWTTREVLEDLFALGDELRARTLAVLA
jgi:hypothetical protein